MQSGKCSLCCTWTESLTIRRYAFSPFPQDGVYPEKVNKGRVGVNNNMRSIGKNKNPAQVIYVCLLHSHPRGCPDL